MRYQAREQAVAALYKLVAVVIALYFLATVFR